MRPSAAVLLLGAGVLGIQLPAQAQIAVQNQGYMPFTDEPISYRSGDIHDPVRKLEDRIEAGRATVTWDDDWGYLKSVLQLLQVPVESQTLVFSKTSFQYPKITPDHPRALYYNDDVYVGKVHDGKAIEIVSFDARQGAIFWLLDEHKSDQPRFQRAELDCTQCHIAAGTRGVPGVLLRSVYPTDTGTLVPGAPQYITDQDSPLSERWGGWFVSAKGAETASLAASIAAAPASTTVQSADPASHKLFPLGTTPYKAAEYLVPGSDPVALLVLAHQTQAHNLITLTNYKTRIALYNLARQQSANAAGDPGKVTLTANTPTPNTPTANTAAADPGATLPDATRRQFERPAEQLLRYFLFVNEAPLTGLDEQALLDSPYARQFAARGPRDSKGRSLRDFDLRTRIFRYPLSYLVYTDAFDAIPEPARSYVLHRLLQILSGQDQSEDFARVTATERRAALEIVLETKPGLPQEWQDYARANHLKLAPAAGNATAGAAAPVADRHG